MCNNNALVYVQRIRIIAAKNKLENNIIENQNIKWIEKEKRKKTFSPGLTKGRTFSPETFVPTCNPRLEVDFAQD